MRRERRLLSRRENALLADPRSVACRVVKSQVQSQVKSQRRVDDDVGMVDGFRWLPLTLACVAVELLPVRKPRHVTAASAVGVACALGKVQITLGQYRKMSYPIPYK